MMIKKKNYGIITIALLAILVLPGLFYQAYQNYGSEGSYNTDGTVKLPEKQGISGMNNNSATYPILNSNDTSTILKNNQTANTLADNIINSINNGAFFEYHSSPSLESTYFGLKILQDLNQLSSINTTLVTNYIKSCFNETTDFFTDSYTGLYNPLESSEQEGYSDVAATDYAMLSLNILGELDLLTLPQKVNIEINIESAINPNDGGFCDPQGYPVTTPDLNSSVMLSYYSYSALMLLDSSALTQSQLDALGSFIVSRQALNSPWDFIQGGFFDKASYVYPSIETSYYAVKLMSAMGKLSDINMTSLTYFINNMTDSNIAGVYSSDNPAGMFYPAPEYYSTALTLAIEEITGITADMNSQNAAQYVLSGLNSNYGYWSIYQGSDKYLLRDNFLLINSYLESGNSFTGLIQQVITPGIQDFLTPIWVNSSFTGDQLLAEGFSPLSDRLSSLTQMAGNIEYLANTGKLNQINATEKTAIYNEVLKHVVYSGMYDSYTFEEFPNYFPNNNDLYCIYGQPLEYAQIPRNSSNLYQFGWGIRQTYEALTILNDTGMLSKFTLSYDLNLFAQDILNSQISYGWPLTGGFAPQSQITSNIEYLIPYNYAYQSIETAYYAVLDLQMFDQILGSNYLGQVNATSLSSYLQSFRHQNSTELYYSDSISNDPSYNAEMTFYVMEINQILRLNLLSSLDNNKIWSWIQSNPDFPGNFTKYEYSGAVWTVMDCKNLESRNNMTLNLTTLRGIYSSWFSSNPALLNTTMINFRQLNILNLLFSDAFSKIVFSAMPSLNVMFSPNIQIQIAGIVSMNELNENLGYRFIENNGTYWNDSSWGNFVIGSGNSYTISSGIYLGEDYYPNFTLEIRNVGDFYDNRVKNFTVLSTFNYGLDFAQLLTNQNSYTNGILNFSFGVYATDNSGDIRPLDNVGTTISVFNVTNQNQNQNQNQSQNQILNPDITKISQIINGMNWITLYLNVSQYSGNYTMNIELSNHLFSENASAIGINSSTNGYITAENVSTNISNSLYIYTAALNYNVINPQQDSQNPNQNTNSTQNTDPNQNTNSTQNTTPNQNSNSTQNTTPNQNSNSTQNTDPNQNLNQKSVQNQISGLAIGGLLLSFGIVFSVAGIVIVKKKKRKGNIKVKNNNKGKISSETIQIDMKNAIQEAAQKGKKNTSIKENSYNSTKAKKPRNKPKIEEKSDSMDTLILPVKFGDQKQPQTMNSKIYPDEIQEKEKMEEKDDEIYYNGRELNSNSSSIEDLSKRFVNSDEISKFGAKEYEEYEDDETQYELMSKEFDSGSDFGFGKEDKQENEKRLNSFKKMIFDPQGFKVN